MASTSSGAAALSTELIGERDRDDKPAEIHRDHDGEVDVESDDDDQPDVLPGEPLKFRLSWRKLWKFAGPGWLMSLAYLDPGNLESDLNQGAYTGMHLLWVLFWATVMGLILQEMSARLGIVTGRDLAQTVRSGYPRWLCYVIYVNMEIAVIGSDIQEVVGTGVALNLLTNGALPVWAGCLITGVDSFTFLAIQYFGVRYLEAFIASLISTMSICFFINWGRSGSNAADLLRGMAEPTVQSWAVPQAVGTIGAVIMPHNLYLHSGLVLSRKVSRARPQRVHDAIWYSRLEMAGALLVAFCLNLAVVAVNATHFYDVGCAALPDGPQGCMAVSAANASGQAVTSSSIACGVDGERVCADFGLRSEGFALGADLGDLSLYSWALGLFAAGQAATMVCTYAGQIIMGGTLQIQLSPWVRVAITRIFALGPALIVATSTITNQRLFNQINEYLNILQSVQLPFAMLPVLHFSADAGLLGRHRSGKVLTGVSTILAVIVISASAIDIYQFIQQFPAGVIAAVSLYFVVYLGLCARMVWTELVAAAAWAGGLLGLGVRATSTALPEVSSATTAPLG